MAAVTIHSDFGAKKIRSVSAYIVSPSTDDEAMGTPAMILVFWMLSFKPAFSLSSFTFIKRRFSSSLLSPISVVSSTYLRFLDFFWKSWFYLVIHLACLAFLMMCSAYKLNKQGDNIQPWCTPFPILNWSVVPHKVLNVASWPTYRFLRSRVRRSGIPISNFHSLLWSTRSRL